MDDIWIPESEILTAMKGQRWKNRSVLNKLDKGSCRKVEVGIGVGVGNENTYARSAIDELLDEGALVLYRDGDLKPGVERSENFLSKYDLKRPSD